MTVNKLMTYLSLLLILFYSSFAQAEINSSLWQGLSRGDYVVLIRHALAPGVGDPPNMQLEQCSTQRNLNEEGRTQARQIGSTFKEHVTQAQVYASQWCRCLETARLLDLGEVTPLSSLNSFFNDSERAKPQTQALKLWLGKADKLPPIVLVTHQVNITALTRVMPESGELIFIQKPQTQDEAIVVKGRIKTLSSMR